MALTDPSHTPVAPCLKGCSQGHIEGKGRPRGPLEGSAAIPHSDVLLYLSLAQLLDVQEEIIYRIFITPPPFKTRPPPFYNPPPPTARRVFSEVGGGVHEIWPPHYCLNVTVETF